MSVEIPFCLQHYNMMNKCPVKKEKLLNSFYFLEKC